MGLLERCQELFNSSNLYEVLGINKEASEADIRKSYYKVSLKVHPDRAPEDPQATEKFQESILHFAEKCFSFTSLLLLFLSQEDEPRLCSIIQAAIKSGEVETFPAFTKESATKKRARRKRAELLTCAHRCSARPALPDVVQHSEGTTVRSV
ncbi:hypothetical protein XENOCAPTIV_026793 [Xenoophorus captivus]|uniref:J domain-containing protein n=1 Tax=Xenoophorus captivus TaxID=1517983 RepID=A0ABV0SE02_9TELE